MNFNELHSLLQDSILSSEPLINPHLQAPPKGSIADRVAIYVDGFYIRLEEVLMSDYGILVAVMGEDEFSAMCRSYMNAYPSKSYSLNFFGEHLSQFLAETAPYNKSLHLAEIAFFEWAEYQSIVAQDMPLLMATDLESLPADQWPDLKFHLHPSCQILSLHWNSLAMIQAVRSDKPLPKPKPLKAAQSVLVWRSQLEVFYLKLKPLELLLLNAIKQQASFIEICGLLSHKMPANEVAAYLVNELYVWLNEQLFVFK